MKKIISIMILFVCMMIAGIAEGKNITLEWDNPTKNIDGSELTNFAGNIVYYGPLENRYQNFIDVGLTNQVTLYGLKAGVKYCVLISSYNIYGCQSKFAKFKFIIVRIRKHYYSQITLDFSYEI
jgi:hypothetical protein